MGKEVYNNGLEAYPSPAAASPQGRAKLPW